MQAKIMEDVIAGQDDVLRLNVGGQHMDVSRRLMTKYKGTLLERTFSGEFGLIKQQDGRIFLDRNGGIFAFLIDCLKHDGEFKPVIPDANYQNLFDLELTYWGLNVESMKAEKQL